MPRLLPPRLPSATLVVILLLAVMLTTVAPAQAAGRVEKDAEGLMPSLTDDRRGSRGSHPS